MENKPLKPTKGAGIKCSLEGSKTATVSPEESGKPSALFVDFASKNLTES